MKIKRIYSILFVQVIALFGLSAQEVRLPLDLPVSFSGTYGELRGNHFHAGYDFRVGGRIGDPIHSIKDGYISRISMSPSGYGKGVYVTHLDGTCAVYGHLSAFTDEIEKLVRKKQYEDESFSVNLYFNQSTFPVKKGDVIGKVGNSGSSVAPHLHLEVRDENGTPFDFVNEGYYDIKDNVPPIFQRIKFYSYVDTTGVPETSFLLGFDAPTSLSRVIELPEKSYICIDAVDKQAGTPGRLAVEHYRVLLDGETIFDFKVGEMPSYKGGYIKSLIEYGESYYSGMDMVKSYVEPGNALRSHIESKNSGLIILEDTLVHKLRVEVRDGQNNLSAINYRVKRGNKVQPQGVSNDGRVPMFWNLPNVYRADSLSFAIPAASLYRSILLNVEERRGFDPNNNIYSSIWSIGDYLMPMHKAATIHIKADVPDSLQSKALIMKLNSNGVESAVGGKWVNGGVQASVSSFGTYYVAIDTIAPQLSFSFKESAKVTSRSVIYARMRDNLSGIRSYRVEIDGKWALSYTRRGRIEIVLDPNRFNRGKNHKIVVTAEDSRGNSSRIESDFYW